MKKSLLVVVIALFVPAPFVQASGHPTEILTFDGVASILETEAQQPTVPPLLGPGRKDPTGQRRYVQYGAPVPYPGATVVADFPKEKCKPPAEMVNALVWNTVEEGQAILSRLTPEARINTLDDGSIYLCHCAKGSNRIFLAKSEETVNRSTENLVKTQERVIERQGGNVTQTTNFTFSGLPQYERGPSQNVQTCRDIKAKNYNSLGSCKYRSNTWKWVVGTIAVVGGGYATWYYLQCPPGTVRR